MCRNLSWKKKKKIETCGVHLLCKSWSFSLKLFVIARQVYNVFPFNDDDEYSNNKKSSFFLALQNPPRVLDRQIKHVIYDILSLFLAYFLWEAEKLTKI